MIEIKDSQKFESIITNIEQSKQRIEEIFRNTTTNMQTIDDTDVWTGLAQKEFSNQYRKLASNYGAIQASMNTYINLMRQAITDYKELENQRRIDIENNGTDLDVNS